MAKALPGLFGGTNLLDLDSTLWAELEAYAGEESRVQREAAARKALQEQRGQRGAGRMPRRGRSHG